MQELLEDIQSSALFIPDFLTCAFASAGAAVLSPAAAGSAAASTFPLDVSVESAGGGGDLRPPVQQGPSGLSLSQTSPDQGESAAKDVLAKSWPRFHNESCRERIFPWESESLT